MRQALFPLNSSNNNNNNNNKNNKRKHFYLSAAAAIGALKVDIAATCDITLPITKTYLYNIDPLKPHFYIVKLGFIGVYIIFLISAQNIDCGYSLEPPRRGGSNE